VRSFDIDFDWTSGFRAGLWYFDFSQWEDVMWNTAICLDLGFFSLRLWIGPKEEDEIYFEEE